MDGAVDGRMLSGDKLTDVVLMDGCCDDRWS